MATGLVGSTNGVFTWRILDARTSTNSAPSGSSAGLANPKDNIWPLPQKAVVAVYSTAGSATMTATIKLWGYLTDAARWFPLGIGADALKGVMNGGAAIGETGLDFFRDRTPRADQERAFAAHPHDIAAFIADVAA